MGNTEKEKVRTSHKVMSWRKFGLTLLELLVVIGIIVVLASILYLAFGPVREAARQRVCVSNLRQIGQALQMYRRDWDGVEAQQGQDLKYWQLGLPPMESLGYFVEQYCKSWAIFRCPDANIPEYQLSSYYWYPDPDGPFHLWVKKRGEEAIVSLCDWHNPVSHPQLFHLPYWHTKTLIFLRLNEQVVIKRVPVREWAPEKW